MITLVHGGQTGVDRGAHRAAIASGWNVSGYMPSDRRDERGPIPDDVAKFLQPHVRSGYGARTEANVQSVNAALLIVRDRALPRETPGTAKTIDLLAQRHLPWKIVDMSEDPAALAHWIWSDLIMPRTPNTMLLPLQGFQFQPAPMRLLVAGPRESKWGAAEAAATELLAGIARAIEKMRRPHDQR